MFRVYMCATNESTRLKVNETTAAFDLRRILSEAIFESITEEHGAP